VPWQFFPPLFRLILGGGSDYGGFGEKLMWIGAAEELSWLVIIVQFLVFSFGSVPFAFSVSFYRLFSFVSADASAAFCCRRVPRFRCCTRSV
jgi:hypothetical protein